MLHVSIYKKYNEISDEEIILMKKKAFLYNMLYVYFLFFKYEIIFS